MNEIFLLILLIIIPLLLVFLETKIKFIKSIGAILIGYILGVVFSLINFDLELANSIKENTAYASALIALPLLIISNNIKDIFNQLRKSVLTGVLGFASLLVVILVSFYFFNDKITDLWKISGILFGLYTGGTPNMVAIQTSLKLDANIFLTLTLSDMLITGSFLLFAILLIKFSKNGESLIKDKNISSTSKKYELSEYIKLIIISIIIILISFIISNYLFINYLTVSLIIFVTTFSILLPIIYKKYDKRLSYNLGNIFIIIFSFSISSMMDIKSLDINNLWILVFVGIVLFSTFILHLTLSKLFKIPLDFVIIVAVSLICSPAFVPLIIGYTKNKSLLIPGISIGILGYIVGNYLGISIAFLLK